MVDFQSRDTRRGVGDGPGDDEDDSDDDGETEAGAGTAGEQPADTGEADAAGAEHDRESRTVSESVDPGTTAYAVMSVEADGTIDEDAAGDAVIDAVEASGGAVVTRELVVPDYDGIQTAIAHLARREDVDAVVTAGGTGVEPDDATVDAAEALFHKHLPGFGELYRVLSHEQEGTAVVRTRATAGIINGVPVFCLPGNPEAARRGVERIVVAEAPTLAAQARTDEE
jgi:molybdenum cofactor biosynthesis protein B